METHYEPHYMVQTKLVRERAMPYTVVLTSEEVVKYLEPLISDYDREVFMILGMANNNKILVSSMVHIGSVKESVIDVSALIRICVLANAPSAIVAHNHPSGNRKPSPEDIKVTQKIATAFEFCDLRILDHIIVTPGSGYFSFADEGLIKT